MTAPREYPDDLRERGQWLAAEACEQEPDLPLNAAVKRIDPRVESTRLFGLHNGDRDAQVGSVVYLSAVEVGGVPDGARRLQETDLFGFDPLLVRNCYSQSKPMAEAMCAAFAAQHGVPVKVLRPTLTFGPGLPEHEGRVFAQFARCAAEGATSSCTPRVGPSAATCTRPTPSRPC